MNKITKFIVVLSSAFALTACDLFNFDFSGNSNQHSSEMHSSEESRTLDGYEWINCMQAFNYINGGFYNKVAVSGIVIAREYPYINDDDDPVYFYMSDSLSDPYTSLYVSWSRNVKPNVTTRGNYLTFVCNLTFNHIYGPSMEVISYYENESAIKYSGHQDVFMNINSAQREAESYYCNYSFPRRKMVDHSKRVIISGNVNGYDDNNKTAWLYSDEREMLIMGNKLSDYFGAGYESNIYSIIGLLSFTEDIYGSHRAVLLNADVYSVEIYHRVGFDTQCDYGIEEQIIKDGGRATRPADPVYPNNPYMSFEGWYTDYSYTELFNFNTIIRRDYWLVAKWNYSGEYYTVNYHSNNPYTEMGTQSFRYGEMFWRPEDPSTSFENCKYGVLEGWYKDSSFTKPFYDFDKPVYSSFDLYAKWMDIDKAFAFGLDPIAQTYSISSFYSPNAQKIYIPAEYNGKNITSIDSSTFTDLANLQIVCFNDSKIATINSYAFQNCSALTYVELYNGDNLRTIKSNAIYNCRTLWAIGIPSSVTSIEKNAFNGCYELNHVYFGGTKNQWNQINKPSTWKNGTNISTIYCSDGEIYL